MSILRDIGAPGIIIIILGALLILGPKRLPEFGQAIGKMFSEFKKAATSNQDDQPSKTEETEKKEE